MTSLTNIRAEISGSGSVSRTTDERLAREMGFPLAQPDTWGGVANRIRTSFWLNDRDAYLHCGQKLSRLRELGHSIDASTDPSDDELPAVSVHAGVAEGLLAK